MKFVQEILEVIRRRLLVTLQPKQRSQIGSLASGWDGTTRTEPETRRTKFSAVLPISACFKPVQPCVAVMILRSQRNWLVVGASLMFAKFMDHVNFVCAPFNTCDRRDE